MRDLYRALGLSGITADRSVIEQALEQTLASPDICKDVRFVLLDPVRKARYDWVLRRAGELAGVRSSLGLAVDPELPGSHVIPGPMAWEQKTAPVTALQPARGGWIAATVLFVALLLWAGVQVNRALQGPHSVIGQTSQGPGAARNLPSGETPVAATPEEPVPIAPPEHGWLQLSPEAHLHVPWQIDTEPGRDYVLTLIDASSQVVVVTLFLRGGEPYQGLAPEGAFELAYTSGVHWFGVQHGFGAKAKVVKPAMTYRVQAGPAGEGSWRLRLSQNSCEGIPTAPAAPKAAATPDANPTTSAADRSL